MNNKDFNETVKYQVLKCCELLELKGDEYSHEKDRLEHFKKAAGLTGETPKKALFGMLLKHIVSLSDMCSDPITQYTKERWQEKITDSINYLLILRAMIEEDE